MKCTILYGPPAVGKLTVAKELAKLTNAKIFDSRQIIDIVEPVVSRENPEFIALIYSLQLQILNAAMRFGKQNIIFVFTFSASTRPDVALLQTILEAGQTHSVAIELVHLTANKHTLEQRAMDETRKGTGKITDPKLLDALFERYDFESPFPDKPGININTSRMTAQEVAQQIVRTTKTAA